MVYIYSFVHCIIRFWIWIKIDESVLNFTVVKYSSRQCFIYRKLSKWGLVQIIEFFFTSFTLLLGLSCSLPYLVYHFSICHIIDDLLCPLFHFYFAFFFLLNFFTNSFFFFLVFIHFYLNILVRKTEFILFISWLFVSYFKSIIYLLN